MSTKLFRNHGPIRTGEFVHWVGSKTRRAFYLLLGALVIAHMMRFGLNVGRYFRPPVLDAGVSTLDSFSEPSTAAAILRQKAELLLGDYTEARNAAWALNRSATQRSPQSTSHEQEESNPIHFVGFVRRSALEISRIQPLEKLESTIQNLNLDLSQKLLVVYCENHYENELIDTFLRVLEESPECPELLEWVRLALDCSQHCGRSEEVEDALQHTLRFHPNVKTAPQLSALKQEWDRGHQTRPNR